MAKTKKQAATPDVLEALKACVARLKAIDPDRYIERDLGEAALKRATEAATAEQMREACADLVADMLDGCCCRDATRCADLVRTMPLTPPEPRR